jgi:hypothetical protein
MARTRLAAGLVGGGLLVAQAGLLAGLLAGPAAADPPGNNGTVKIEEADVDSVDDDNNANHPHVACPFAVRWYGYDEGTQTTEVAFAAQMPSGTAAVPMTAGRASFTFDGHGPGDQVDHTEVYELDVAGLVEQENQGYHIKATITTTGSQGNDTKHKVFWMSACAEETPTPTPSVSPSETPSVEPSVLPTVIESPTVTPSVLGVKIVKPGQLPFTGPAWAGPLAAFGFGLVLTGAGLLVAGQRGAHQH